MRKITSNDVIKNKYSLENGSVVESQNGKFYSKQIANQALHYQNTNQLEQLDQMEKNSAVEKICLNRYVNLKAEENVKFKFDEKPSKKYEIYQLCLDKEKIMLCDTKYFQDSTEKEVYYDKNIAFEVYELISQLKENVINSFPELMEMYEQDIAEKQDRIETLKREDKIKYEEAIRTYELINKSDIFQEMKNDYECRKKENIKLKEQLKKSENIVNDLSKKLQVSLEKYEELKHKKVSFWERIVGFFNRQKRLSSGEK